MLADIIDDPQQSTWYVFHGNQCHKPTTSNFYHIHISDLCCIQVNTIIAQIREQLLGWKQKK